MSTSLGDKLNDTLQDVIADIVNDADRREDELLSKISDLEDELAEVEEEYYQFKKKVEDIE
jgi:hypothetical protein